MYEERYRGVGRASVHLGVDSVMGFLKSSAWLEQCWGGGVSMHNVLHA